METHAIKADIYFLLKMKYIFTAAYLDNHLTCNIFRYNKNDRVNTELHIGMLWKIYINRRRLQCLGNR